MHANAYKLACWSNCVNVWQRLSMTTNYSKVIRNTTLCDSRGLHHSLAHDEVARKRLGLSGWRRLTLAQNRSWPADQPGQGSICKFPRIWNTIRSVTFHKTRIRYIKNWIIDLFQMTFSVNQPTPFDFHCKITQLVIASNKALRMPQTRLCRSFYDASMPLCLNKKTGVPRMKYASMVSFHT